MKRVWASVIFLIASIFLLIGSTFAWFSSAKDLFQGATISSGKMDIVVALYHTLDVNKDGSGDWYTKEEVTAFNAFEEFPEDITTAGQYFAKRVVGETEEYYHVYEKMDAPYAIDLAEMLPTETYSYLVVVKNMSRIRGRLVTTIEGCRGGIADLLMFNDQKLHDLVDDTGKGRYFFTYHLDEEAPDNGLTPEENAIVLGDQELAYLPLDMRLFNDLNNSQKEYMKKASINVTASIEIEQVLSEKE